MAYPRGAYAPIPTPVGDDGLLQPDALERHLSFLEDGGLTGVLVLGTNGEFPSFDLNERMAVAEAAARFGGGLELMLGIGSCAAAEAAHLVQTAAHFGYGAALLPPPFYFRNAPSAGLTGFFRSVLDAAEIPVLLYHIPQVTGIAISDEILDAVEGHPRFAGVKDSSGVESDLERFTSRLEDRSYLVGHDRLLSVALAAGGSGSITAVASVAPALVVAVGDDPSRQPELDRVRRCLESRGLGPAVKAILRARGVGDYRTRPPLLGLDDDDAAQLVAEFHELVTR
ncbi:MAG: dihydrodipicolinate synthase family protein [Thermoanaerobaculales bacterium]|jgi:4-hydroxy-tetrahydrodipicolinate synthase|nr:dihydrodipicolinate synthase family protein [Thermoanaerobaculales bacterium]